MERHVNEFSPEVINKIVYYSTYILYCLESIGLRSPDEAFVGAYIFISFDNLLVVSNFIFL